MTTPGAITKVFFEEIGHYLDAHLGLGDARGDEGAIFAGLVMGETYTPQELLALFIENDITTVTLDDEIIQIEQSNLISQSYTLEELVSGEISEKGKQDFYTFSGRTGQRFYFDALESRGGTLATLYSPTNQQVMSSWFHNQDPNPFTLLESGEYRLVIDGNGEATESYGLKILPLESITRINYGQEREKVSGKLLGGKETHLYQISGKQGQVISLKPTVIPANTWWTLYNTGNQAVWNVLANTERQVTLPHTGTYTLAVRGNNSSDTEYGFEISEVTPGTAVPIHSGIDLELDTVVSGSVTTSGAYVDYTFTGFAGQHLFYDILVNTPYFNVQLYDRGPNYNLTLATDGLYRISIGGRGTGYYKFQLLNLSDGVEVDLDTDIVGTFDEGVRNSVAYRFNLEERTYLYVDGEAGNGAWLIYNSGGVRINSARLYQDREFWLDSGEYLLVAQGYGSDINYNLRLITPEKD